MPATSIDHDSHNEPVWVGMDIPSCSEGCGGAVSRAGDACTACSSFEHLEERRAVRVLIGDLVDQGVPVSREAVAV